MLSVQAKTTLVAYVILMMSFLVPLDGDKSIGKKIALILVMLIPIVLAVYTVNCLVTGSEGKLGLGCNVLAWINSISILLCCTLILLFNMSGKKLLVEEKFDNHETLILGGGLNPADVVISASSNLRNSYPINNILDGDGTSVWISGDNIDFPHYIKIEFPNAKKLSSFTMSSGSIPLDYNQFPKTFQLWATNGEIADDVYVVDGMENIYEEYDPNISQMDNKPEINYSIAQSDRGSYSNYILKITSNYYDGNSSLSKRTILEKLELYEEVEEPVDCVMGSWAESGSCVTEGSNCGSGTQTRTRTITTNPANGGSACESTSQTQSCHIECQTVEDSGGTQEIQSMIDTVSAIQGTSGSSLTGNLTYNVELIGSDTVEFCFESDTLESDEKCLTFNANN